MAKEWEIEQACKRGFIRTKIDDYDGKPHLHLWAADEAGRDSQTTLITDAAECRNLADTLRDYANLLDELDGYAARANAICQVLMVFQETAHVFSYVPSSPARASGLSASSINANLASSKIRSSK